MGASLAAPRLAQREVHDAYAKSESNMEEEEEEEEVGWRSVANGKASQHW